MERTRWGLVALLFTMGLLAAAQFGKVSLTLVEHAALFGRSETDVALLVSLVGLTGLVFGAVAGAIVAWLTPRRAILLGLGLGGGVSLVQAVLPPLEAYIALRLIEGIPHLVLVVAAPPVMAMVATDKDRPVVMSIWAMFFGLSFALSALLFPPILQVGGLRALFAVHGLALWAVLLALWPLLPKTPPAPLSLNVLRTHQEIYTNLSIMAPGLGFVFYTVTYVALLTYMPLALARPDLYVSLPLISLAATLGAGYVCRQFTPDRVAVAGFALTLVAAFCMALGAQSWVYVVFLGLGIVPGASFAAIPHFNSELADRTRSTGAIAQLGNLGTVTGTPIFAGLLAGFGLPGILLGLAGFCLAGAVMVLTIGRSLRLYKR